jgi:hypothetical protein
MMHWKRTAISLAIPDLMSANLLRRIFNEAGSSAPCCRYQGDVRQRLLLCRCDWIRVWLGWSTQQGGPPTRCASRFRFQPSGPALAHHGLACQRWRFGPPAAYDAITGIDVAIFEKGFIKALYVFIDGGPSASLARGWPLSV